MHLLQLGYDIRIACGDVIMLSRVLDNVKQTGDVPRALSATGLDLGAVGGELTIPRGLQKQTRV